jgi:hypothetical protein
MLIEQRPRLCPGAMLESLVEYCVHGNMPISQVDAPFFRKFISCVTPESGSYSLAGRSILLKVGVTHSPKFRLSIISLCELRTNK